MTDTQQQSTLIQTTQSQKELEKPEQRKCSSEDCDETLSRKRKNFFGNWYIDDSLCDKCNYLKIFSLIAAMMKRGNFPKEYWNLAKEQYKNKVINWETTSFSRNKIIIDDIKDTLLSKPNLVIMLGSHGTGKTLLGSYFAALSAFYKRNILYAKQNELSIRIRGSYISKTESEWTIYKELADVDFLVMDEIGAFLKGSDADNRYLQAIISGRHDRQKPLVLISNLNYKQFIETVGSWIEDRLKGEHVSILDFSGESHRGK